VPVCLSIHGYVGKAVNNLSDEAVLASRRGRSSDAKADAALRFARAVLETRGSVGDDEVRAVRDAGFGDREISEIVAHVALNVLTNFFNKVAQVEVEFPAAQPLSAAA
jgi:alkylhydroperoxidase family enzyme